MATRRSIVRSASAFVSNNSRQQQRINFISRGYISSSKSFSSSRPSSFIVTNNNKNNNRHYMSTAAVEAPSSPLSIVNDLFTKLNNDNNNVPLEGNDVKGAMEALLLADAVCFDVDSTVIAEEGIDVLADFLNKGEEVAALTNEAMNGDMLFQDALEGRLNLLQPSLADIQACLEQCPFQFTSGIRSLVQTLQNVQKDVYLVSGGFRIMIRPIAETFHISPTDNVIANTILFDNGQYRGFDTTEPTSMDGGKSKALQQILNTNPNYKTIVMVGDGATDAQAKPPARAFIGFGGVVQRQAVREQACWYVNDFGLLETVVRESNQL